MYIYIYTYIYLNVDVDTYPVYIDIPKKQPENMILILDDICFVGVFLILITM